MSNHEEEDLLSAHNDEQLNDQLDHTAGRIAVFQPLAGDPRGGIVMTLALLRIVGYAGEAALDERNVEQRRVVVDELEEEHLQRVAVVVLGLRPMALHVRQLQRQNIVDLKESEKFTTKNLAETSKFSKQLKSFFYDL